MSAVSKRKRIVNEVFGEDFLPKGNQVIVRIDAPAGNNLHEAQAVVDGVLQKFLISMPTKLRKSYYVKRGDFAICEWIEEGDKVRAEMIAPLTQDGIDYIKSQNQWPEQLDAGDELTAASPATAENVQADVEQLIESKGWSVKIIDHEEIRVQEKLQSICAKHGGVLVKHVMLSEVKSGLFHMMCLHPDTPTDLSKLASLTSGFLYSGLSSVLIWQRDADAPTGVQGVEMRLFPGHGSDDHVPDFCFVCDVSVFMRSCFETKLRLATEKEIKELFSTNRLTLSIMHLKLDTSQVRQCYVDENLVSCGTLFLPFFSNVRSIGLIPPDFEELLGWTGKKLVRF